MPNFRLRSTVTSYELKCKSDSEIRIEKDKLHEHKKWLGVIFDSQIGKNNKLSIILEHI